MFLVEAAGMVPAISEPEEKEKSMREKKRWMQLFLACLMAGTLALAGCSGDDGDDGVAGPPGPAGEKGDTGDQGPAGEPGTDASLGIVSQQSAEAEQCLTCHSTIPDAVLKEAPFGDEVTERFITSRHANQSARSNFCSACHSHEGAVELLDLGRFTSTTDLVAQYTPIYEADPVLQVVGSSTIDGVTKKACSTCHLPTGAHLFGGPALRGDGDITAAMLGATGTTTQEATVVYSAEFNLCTACHMVDLVETNTGTGRLLYDYALSPAYTKANMIDATTGTFISSYDRPFYHDGASGNGRTMADTHFGGTILRNMVEFPVDAEPANAITVEDIVIKGYNVNPGAANACTTCHDPHTAGKMLSVDSSATYEYADVLDNKAVGYAEGLGDFHNSPELVAYRQTGCAPCHTGDNFAAVTNGATPDDAWAWGTIGCRSCHDLAVANAEPNVNNAAAFAEVREFPSTQSFKFNSGAAVTVAELGVNQVCFECHKGRDGVKANADTTTQVYEISYLHYAPSYAVLFGDDSKMVPTYPGKTYAGRFVHPVANAAGSFEFGCVDCHDVHNTNGNDAAGNMMTNPAYSCNSCHGVGSLSAANLKARTVNYGQRLHDTIIATYNARFDPDITADQFHAIISGRGAATEIGANDLAKAASIYKIFNYEDGSPTGTEHGHGGSWAHNSVFARQVQFDAIESLVGDTTGLSRP